MANVSSLVLNNNYYHNYMCISRASAKKCGAKLENSSWSHLVYKKKKSKAQLTNC